MSKTRIVVALLVLVCMPVMVFADFREHIDRLEFGVSAGVGFYVGQSNPLKDSELLRIQSYNAAGFGDKSTLKWPGIETFGFSLGYRFDTRWHLRLQAMRQRVCFAEYESANITSTRCVYYNAMWHLDMMAEFNILNYGNSMMPEQNIYNVVPYVGLGLGITMFNENATLRSNNMGEKIGSFYPQVGGKDNEVAVAMYVPVALGVKWRINDYVQLKASFQYQLYFSNKGTGGLNSNLEGGSYAEYINANTRPKFDELTKHIVGHNHDCLFSLSAIFNIEEWREERIITY